MKELYYRIELPNGTILPHKFERLDQVENFMIRNDIYGYIIIAQNEHAFVLARAALLKNSQIKNIKKHKKGIDFLKQIAYNYIVIKRKETEQNGKNTYYRY